MIHISEAAQAHFVKLLEKQATGTNIRVFVVNPGTAQAECGVSYCSGGCSRRIRFKSSLATVLMR